MPEEESEDETAALKDGANDDARQLAHKVNALNNGRVARAAKIPKLLLESTPAVAGSKQSSLKPFYMYKTPRPAAAAPSATQAARVLFLFPLLLNPPICSRIHLPRRLPTLLGWP